MFGVFIVYSGCIVSRVTLTNKELLLLLMFLDYKKSMEAFQILVLDKKILLSAWQSYHVASVFVVS